MGVSLYLQKDLNLAKKDVEQYRGRSVTVKSNGGRQKIKKFEGVIGDTYPSVFTIILKNGKGGNLKTYSYVDLLTNNVELYLK